MGVFMGEKRQGEVTIRRVRGRNVIEGPIYYRVIATNKFESRLSICQTPGLPIVGLTISLSLGLCKSKHAVRHPLQPLEYEVICVFSSEVEEGTDPSTQQSGSGGSADPTTWIPIAEGSFEDYEELFVYDRSEPPRLFKNTAHQRFAEKISLPMTIVRWDFFQFEPATLTLAQIADRNDTVNASPIFGAATKTLLLKLNKWTLGYYYTTRCWLIEYTLRYKKNGWLFKIPSTGTQYYSGGELKDYLSKDGSIIEGNLDAAGNRVADGTEPYVLEFNRFSTSTFSFLRLQ